MECLLHVTFGALVLGSMPLRGLGDLGMRHL